MSTLLLECMLSFTVQTCAGEADSLVCDHLIPTAAGAFCLTFRLIL